MDATSWCSVVVINLERVNPLATTLGLQTWDNGMGLGEVDTAWMK